MSTTLFTAEVDAELLAQVNAALAEEGDTLPGLLDQLMHYIAVKGRAPDLPCIEPNAETLAALAEADRGDLIAVGSIACLLAELNKDD